MLRVKPIVGLVTYNGLLARGCATVTLIDAIVILQFSVPVLTSLDTKVFHHLGHTWSNYHRMIDACCGIGGVAYGVLAVCVQTTVATEFDPRMTEIHKSHEGSECVVGGIVDHQIVAEVWRQRDNAAMMSAGFSCQLCSNLGAQCGSLDPCAMNLSKLLRASHLMQIMVLVSERVVPARTDAVMPQQLDRLAKKKGPGGVLTFGHARSRNCLAGLTSIAPMSALTLWFMGIASPLLCVHSSELFRRVAPLMYFSVDRNEVLHPGPGDATFVLGIANPTGLRSFRRQIKELDHPTVLGVSTAA